MKVDEVGGDVAQGGADRAAEAPSVLCQEHRSVAPFEQRGPEILLKLSDLFADRRLGQTELVRRQGEAFMARGGLEAAQGGERRQMAGDRTHNCGFLNVAP